MKKFGMDDVSIGVSREEENFEGESGEHGLCSAREWLAF